MITTNPHSARGRAVVALARRARKAGAIAAVGFLAACSSNAIHKPIEATDVPAESTVTQPQPQDTLQLTNQPARDTYYFEFDESVLDESTLTSLRQHSMWLKEDASRSLVIEGHADERGSREYNLALGESRAQVVRAFLIAQGVAPQQIETVSYGEEQPAMLGRSEEAWSKNRRAFLNYPSSGGESKLANN